MHANSGRGVVVALLAIAVVGCNAPEPGSGLGSEQQGALTVGWGPFNCPSTIDLYLFDTPQAGGCTSSANFLCVKGTGFKDLNTVDYPHQGDMGKWAGKALSFTSDQTVTLYKDAMGHDRTFNGMNGCTTTDPQPVNMISM